MNNTGQLGLSDTEPRYEPTLVTALQDSRMEKIMCGEAHTAAIDGRSWHFKVRSPFILNTFQITACYIPGGVVNYLDSDTCVLNI